MSINSRGRGGRRRRRGRRDGRKSTNPHERIIDYYGVKMKAGVVYKFDLWIQSALYDNEEDRDYFFFNNFVVKNKREQLSNSKIQKTEDEEMPSPLPFISVPKEVKLLKNKTKVNKWIIENIFSKGVRVVGIDTEFDAVKCYGNHRYDFTQSYFPDLIQISTTTSILLIQNDEGAIRPCQGIIDLFTDQNIHKTFCNVISDYKKINNWFLHHGNVSINLSTEEEGDLTSRLCENFRWVDIDPNNRGLGNLCEMYLKCQMKKDPLITISRWSKKRLTHQQIEYAADDPYVTLLLWLNEERRCKENVEQWNRYARRKCKIKSKRSVRKFFEYWVEFKRIHRKGNEEEKNILKAIGFTFRFQENKKLVIPRSILCL